jgi:1-acyl-sn-glycerol-3-phosphate acyltransferase
MFIKKIKALSAKKQHLTNDQDQALQYWRSEKQWYHSFLCSGVVHASQMIMNHWNTLTFDGKERWDAIFDDRKSKNDNTVERVGILSFSNHVSLFDDPLLVSNLGLSHYHDVRWIAADSKNFFGNNLKGLIYSAGKCVPIIRGGGLEQRGFDFLVERLQMGDWVHIFPEGGRTREFEGQLQLPFKIGIGKLIYEARPLLMPFYHYGMHEVLPIGNMIPNRGKKVQIKFGEAHCVDDNWWFQRLGTRIQDVEPRFAWQRATDWTEQMLVQLERDVHPLCSQKIQHGM